LLHKLKNLPGKVSAQLYKQADDIGVIKAKLLNLNLGIGQCLNTTAAAKVGRTPAYAKKAAAQQLHCLFKRFNLEWKANTWERVKKTSTPALTALSWIFDQAADQTATTSLAPYINALNESAIKKPAKK